MQDVINYSISALKVHPKNSEFFDDISGKEYEVFKKSIQEEGVITPLIVAPDMTLISGHQRLKACQDLGIMTVPAIVMEGLDDEDEKTKKLLAANFGRLKNNPMKQSKVISEYEKLCGIGRGGDRKSKPHNAVLKQEDIAAQFGVSVDTLQRLKSLQKLTPELQELVETGELKPKLAYSLWAKLPENEQVRLVGELGKDKITEMTQAQTQEYIDKIKTLEEEKVKEIANIKAGYEKKLEVAKKKSDNSETLQLMEEKEELQTKLRKQYEQSQQLKKQLDEAKKKGGELPEDYGQMKLDYEKSQRRIEELEINLKNERITNQIKKEVPQSKFPQYDFDYFNNACAEYVRCVGYYKYKKDELSSVSADEASAYLSCIKTVYECLETIKIIINKEEIA